MPQPLPTVRSPFSAPIPRTAPLTSTGPATAAAGVKASLIIQAMLLMLLVANLGRIPVLSTGERQAPILVNDLCVGVILGATMLSALRARSLRLDLVTLAGLGFAAVGAASAALAVPRFGLSPFELLVGLAYLARWMWYAGIYVAVVNLVRRDDALAVWSSAERMLLLFAAFGILQSAFLPGFAQLVYPNSRDYYDWDVQGRRLVSTVLEPNIAGAMLLTGFLVTISRLTTGALVARWKILVLFTALVLTLSRSTALGLIAGSAVIVLARGVSKRMIRLLLAIGALLACAAPLLLRFAAGYGKLHFDASAAARLVSWVRAWQAFRDHPVIGVGFNTFGFVLDRVYGIERLGTASYSSDGGLLFIAAMTGLLGLLLYLVMCGLVVSHCRFVWRSPAATAQERGFAIGVAATLVAMVVDSLFVNSLLTPFVMELLWVQWGLVFVIRSQLQRATSGSSASVQR